MTYFLKAKEQLGHFSSHLRPQGIANPAVYVATAAATAKKVELAASGHLYVVTICKI